MSSLLGEIVFGWPKHIIECHVIVLMFGPVIEKDLFLFSLTSGSISTDMH